ncbi:hypothetical protein J1605_006117 [Eschrichtius robustus]|uniref:Uncharacterized protein n=1 Tax=Eschrichtius robustus TaxID=9764 RepID=A0AB34H5E9_ESCRO|nr:hypothetical protein J1605_006117 [Eschrichtius robustus]
MCLLNKPKSSVKNNTQVLNCCHKKLLGHVKAFDKALQHGAGEHERVVDRSPQEW